MHHIVKPIWTGDTAFIIGGGPSLDVASVPRLCGRIITVNNAYRLAPRADVWFWGDRRWFDWHRDAIVPRPGCYNITREGYPVPSHVLQMRFLAGTFSTEPDALGGFCSGSSALNLAFLFGASRIVLLGFDMRPSGNWHDDHRSPSRPDQYARRFVPCMQMMVRSVRERGVTVDVTPGSGID